MERINEWLLTSIQGSLEYIVYKINYYVYKMEWPIIIIGLILAVILIIINREKYSYRYELSRVLKISTFMLVLSYLIKALSIKTITPIFDTIFYNFMPITIIAIIIGYLLDKFLFYKSSKDTKLEIRYIKYTTTVTYIFLLISGMYSLKDIILPFIWQVNLISIIFCLESRQDKHKQGNCTLYETRKKQLNILKDIINHSNYENYAIAINGEWGSGKSEFILALINECKKDSNYHVYIKPMVSDTQESLIREFQKAISVVMKRNGIYSGRNSSIDKYFKEILKLIQVNTKFSFSDIIDFINDDNSYKDLKKDLQEDIDSLLNKRSGDKSKRLIVVIDDFDRLEEDKQIGILSFIKEIIDFDGCITIIALDYENLKSNKVVKPVYLEKFIATQIPLVDMEFEEIIRFHAKDILNTDSLNSDFSKKIIHDIKDNIYDYYNNIETRIMDYYHKRDKSITESEEATEVKNASKETLKDFLNFSIKRRKIIDNSRRVIHFLNEMQNTVYLIDQLYSERIEGEKLLKTVNVSETIYFFNYVKVFYKEAYELIVKHKGIEEYCADLISNEKKLEERYFRVILGDIVPNLNPHLRDEKVELSRNNTLNLIKDIFINYHFTKNNIDLITNSEKCVKEIDENNIFITDNYFESIQAYQDAIFKYDKNEKERVNRVERLVTYIIMLYKQGKINFGDILQLASYRNNNRNMIYTKCYLREACDLIDKQIVNKIYEKDKWRIQSILRDLDMDNTSEYRYIFIELLSIATIGKYKDDDINKLFDDVITSDQVFEKMKKYSIENALIQEQNNIVNLQELLRILLDEVKSGQYLVVDIELLNKRLQEFLLNYEYIFKLQRFENGVNRTDKYKELSYNFNIKDALEVKVRLSDLAKEQSIDYKMISFFQKLINFIVTKGILKDIGDEEKKNIEIIFGKIKKEACWSEHQWFDIMVNVERCLK